ncbi:MAG: hypothetical protein V7604_2727 [Hyphomicrobiales bacterium]|jgi:hypothetical protein
MEQAVLVYLRLIDHPFGSDREREAIFDLEDMLCDAIDGQDVGLFDGEEFGGGRCVLFMYGPDADRLFAVVEPVLKASRFMRSGFVIKRYGPAEDYSAVEVRVNF